MENNSVTDTAKPKEKSDTAKPKAKSDSKAKNANSVSAEKSHYNDPASMEDVDSKVLSEELPKEFPYQVSLRLLPNFQHFCAGAIISPRHVVTVAHCICFEDDLKPESQIVVTAGLVYEDFKGARSWRVRRIICHPQYNRTERFHDIALICISGSFQFTDKIKMIPMMNYPSAVGDLNVLISDWNRHQHLGQTVEHLQYIDSKTIDIDICRNMIKILSLFNFNKNKTTGRLVMDWNVCTFDFGAREQKACSGDSGAPVVYKDHLLALESWADECHNEVPGVHTSISFHYLWIKNECEKDSFYNYRYAMYLNKFRNIY